ncbi:hypothetical protein [Streptomyces sp. NPDC059009]|uniref:hypothetical protein n=1 Tax=Streptomyces sp. NPDC059009 TaxID=3346694 RepID=UPI0036762DD4
MIKRMTFLAAAVSLAAASTGAATGATGATGAGGWVQVGSGMTEGISGLAASAHSAHSTRSGDTVRALVVRDNKKPGENRVAQLSYGDGASSSASVTPLKWAGVGEPIDLEAIEAVPGGADGEYVALASRGLVYHLTVKGDTAKVSDISPLPAIREGDDYESFTLMSRHGKLAAVWADRGEGKRRPSTVRAAPFSFNKYGEAEFGAVRTATFRAPYPKGSVRHASDMTVTDSGRLLVSSASDAGDDGPFDSAVSDAGRVTVSGSGKVRLKLSKSPDVLRKFTGHKIEAVECAPGTSGSAVLGTDDENGGGAVRRASLCGDH